MATTMLEKLRQKSTSRDNANAAVLVINNTTLSFSDKVAQVEVLDAKSSADEQTLFTEIYSSLHALAQTQADIDLMAGL
jgi:hypothetical protein